jgi:hypothetical protein
MKVSIVAQVSFSKDTTSVQLTYNFIARQHIIKCCEISNRTIEYVKHQKSSYTTPSSYEITVSNRLQLLLFLTLNYWQLCFIISQTAIVVTTK